MKLVRWLAALAAAAGICVAFANDARDAGALSVERFGTRGSPVVLVPGLASGAWVWKDTIDALKETHRVYAVTLAGFDGRAAVAGDPMRVALDALRDLVAKENLEKPVIVGHSLGGMLALQLAAAYPDLLGGVVTVKAFHPCFSTNGLQHLRRVVREPRALAALQRDVARCATSP